MKTGLFVSAIALLCASSALAQDNQADTPEPVSTTFIDAKGEQIGTATLTETPNGVLIAADLTGLPSGMHAFHIHETGKCDAPDGFKSAGGHYAPRGAMHGFKHPDGPHAGDLPNQFVGADGTLKAEVISQATTLRDGETTLFDDDGSALVIHSGTDDYESQPSGDAGGRIACAPITDEQRKASRTGPRNDTRQASDDAMPDSRTASTDRDRMEVTGAEANPGNEVADATQAAVQPSPDTANAGNRQDRQNAGQAEDAAQRGQPVTASTNSMIYSGISADRVMDEEVVGANGEDLGDVYDIVIKHDGTVTAIVVEGGGFLDIGDATFQLPWSDLSATGDGEIRTQITEKNAEERGLYDQPAGIRLETGEFLASQLMDENASVGDGQVYGEVSDIIIGTDGKVVAVLVDRDDDWGGGTYGYPYDGRGDAWMPARNSYPLPFDSLNLAASVPQIETSRIDEGS